MDKPRPCTMCDRSISPGEGYVVRIEVFADPQLPPMTIEDVERASLNGTLAQLMEQIKKMSAEELQDGVHRRFEYRLCPGCHRRYLANPLGMPRRMSVGKN